MPFKKSQENTFERYKEKTGKDAVVKGKITAPFRKWALEEGNCKDIPQKTDADFIKGDWWGKYKAGEITKDEAIAKHKELGDLNKQAGICTRMGDSKRLKGLREYQKTRKEMRKELGLD